jgi:DNA replication protein DnaC
MRSLPDLPNSVGPLTDEDFNRLHRQYPDLWVDPHQSCLTCKKTGEFLGPQGQTKCNCVDQWLLHCCLLNAGIGLAYQRLTWEDVDGIPGTIIKVVQDYAFEAEKYVDYGIGMILRGYTGTGKTLLATLLLKQVIGVGVDGYFTQFNELLDSYTATWRDEAERRWYTKRIRNAGVLVIDDIGKEHKGREQVTGSMFDDVIRHRVAAMKPTIITTNYTMEEVQTGYGGPGIMGLLAERSRDYEVTGTNYRVGKLIERNLREAEQDIRRPIALG